MLQNVEINVTSIAIVGKFNPIIFQPSWLASKGIIGTIEAESADVEIIHRNIVRFKLDWVEFEVTPVRFELKSSKEAFFEPLRDLAESIFLILQETPIDAIGINHTLHIKLKSEEEYKNFGDFLAPLKIWSDSFLNPRILQLEILESKRKDGLNGHYRYKIQSSDLLKPNGIVSNLNNHLNVKSGLATEMVEILTSQWNSSFVFNNELIEDLWKKFKKS